MLNEYFQVDDYISKYIASKDGQMISKGVVRNYKVGNGREQAIAHALLSRKVGFSKLLAEKILTLNDDDRRFPNAVKKLLSVMSNELGMPRKSAEIKNED
jgi:hypothetical protein